MNLFYLDEDFDTNAEYHIDKHVARMIGESCEMLCMAHMVYEVLGFTPRFLKPEEYREVVNWKKQYKELLPEDRPIPYMGRDAHLNHPSTIWVRSSMDNYEWTWCYAGALESERHYRNGTKEHKCIRLCKEKLPYIEMPRGKVPFALAMKDFAKAKPHQYDEDKPIWSYRNFYMYDKAEFASWKHREKPEWWNI